MSLYFDHASTTPPHPAALTAVAEATAGLWADPSRLYGDARRARMALDRAREQIAYAIQARPEEIIFTGSGTESCNLAIAAAAGAARAARKPTRALVSAVEHRAVLAAARALEGFEVVEIRVDGQGLVDLEALRSECEAGAGLVSIQTANSEVGTLQPVAEVAGIARAAGALFHTDACIATGHIPVSVASMGPDLLSASAHKFYGPKGAGFLWARRGVRVRPQLLGDDRERGRRAGMENLPAIAGMAAALDARIAEISAEDTRLRALTDRLREELPWRVEDLVVHGHPTERLPGIVAFSVLYVDGETMLLDLDRRGIAVHSGSSCTSSTQEPSHVLAAMGALTQGSVRVSLGRDTHDKDIEFFLAALPGVVAGARSLAGAATRKAKR
ncbi:MAG: cysteine desulfurase family protein [Actinomycetota bacterium]